MQKAHISHYKEKKLQFGRERIVLRVVIFYEASMWPSTVISRIGLGRL